MAQTARAQRETRSLHLADDAWRLERRVWTRKPAQGHFTMTFRDEDRRGVSPLMVVDTSLDGLGGLSPVRLEPGTRVGLSTGQVPVAVRSGTVVRCEESPGDGAWRVGVRLDSRLCA